MSTVRPVIYSARKNYTKVVLKHGMTVCMISLVLSALGASADPKARSAVRPPPANTKISNATFVAFDLETTGLSPSNDRIVEIGAVKFRNGKIIDQKSWLVNPGRSIPWLVQQVHGITDDMVKDAPDFTTVYKEFSEFIEGTVLMAHNARFDVAFLSAEIARLGLPAPPNKVVDTLKLFRQWFPSAPAYSLPDIVNFAKVDPGIFHRALEDSVYLYFVFQKGLENRSHVTYLRDVYAEAGGVLSL